MRFSSPIIYKLNLRIVGKFEGVYLKCLSVNALGDKEDETKPWGGHALYLPFDRMAELGREEDAREKIFDPAPTDNFSPILDPSDPRRENFGRYLMVLIKSCAFLIGGFNVIN